MPHMLPSWDFQPAHSAGKVDEKGLETTMNRYAKSFLTTASLVIFLFGPICQAQSGATHDDAVRGERIKAFMDSITSEGVGPGSVVMITVDGETVFSHANGHTALDDAMEMPHDAIFNIHSMTKPITSVALMQCWEDGLVKLDDPVSKYLPEFRYPRVISWPEGAERTEATATYRSASRPITIRDLLTHTSGIGYGGKAYGHLSGRIDDAIDSAATLEEFIKGIAPLPILHDPGARFSYGAGPAIAGRVVEVVRNQPIEDVIAERITEPLGMKDTGWTLTDPNRLVRRSFVVPKEEQARFDGRTFADETTGGAELAPNWVPQWEAARTRGVRYGDGGMFSTAEDYTRFLRVIAERGQIDDAPRILAPSTVDLMLENHLPPGVHRGNKGLGFGLGFGTVIDPGAMTELTVPGYFGWGGAANTYAFGDSDRRSTAVFMNALMPSNSRAQNQFRTLALQAMTPRETPRVDPEIPTVETRSGTVEGFRMDDGDITAFLGMPFAAPPIGPLRWMPPQPPHSWEGTRPAKAFGAPCPQPPGMDGMARGMLRQVGEDPGGAPTFTDPDEDCLFINVWTDNLAGQDLEPVMVWIHGGGYRQGAGSFDGSRTCEAGFVSVSFNMRLGALGFFSHPSLSAASPSGTSGNQGLLDVVAALEWVQDNIEAFGGDPNRVMLGGCSAGGGCAGMLLAMPKARGLFHGVFSVSPAPIPISHGLTRGYQGQFTGHEVGEMLAVGSGLAPNASVEELQAVPIEQLMGSALALEGLLIGKDFAFCPRIDGHVLPRPILDQIASGNTPDVPLIIGSASDDHSFVGGNMLRLLAGGDFKGYVQRQLGKEADAAMAVYGNPDGDQLMPTLKRFIRNIVFTGNSRLVAEAWAESGRPAWLYYNEARFPEGHPGHGIGSFHGYAFGNGSLNAIPWDPEGVFEPLNQRMFERLLAMSATGEPNAPGLPHWPTYDSESDPYLLLGIEADAASNQLLPAELDPIQRAYRLKLEPTE